MTRRSSLISLVEDRMTRLCGEHTHLEWPRRLACSYTLGISTCRTTSQKAISLAAGYRPDGQPGVCGVGKIPPARYRNFIVSSGRAVSGRSGRLVTICSNPATRQVGLPLRLVDATNMITTGILIKCLGTNTPAICRILLWDISDQELFLIGRAILHPKLGPKH